MLTDKFSSSSSSESEQFLLFVNSQGHRFCLPLNEVERLLLLMEIQSIPQAPEYLIGLMNLTGEAVPVLDLALRIGVQYKPQYTLETPLVLVNSGSQKGALIIDNIEAVRAVNSDQLRGEKLFQDSLAPLKASVTDAHGTALLLDTQRILELNLSALGGPLELAEELLSLCRIKTTKDDAAPPMAANLAEKQPLQKSTNSIGPPYA